MRNSTKNKQLDRKIDSIVQSSRKALKTFNYALAAGALVLCVNYSVNSQPMFTSTYTEAAQRVSQKYGTPLSESQLETYARLDARDKTIEKVITNINWISMPLFAGALTLMYTNSRRKTKEKCATQIEDATIENYSRRRGFF